MSELLMICLVIRDVWGEPAHLSNHPSVTIPSKDSLSLPFFLIDIDHVNPNRSVQYGQSIFRSEHRFECPPAYRYGLSYSKTPRKIATEEQVIALLRLFHGIQSFSATALSEPNELKRLDTRP